MRLQDGDRTVEVSGSPIFIRQVLEDLPAIWARLRGEAPPHPAAIRMPRPPSGSEGSQTDRTEAIE